MFTGSYLKISIETDKEEYMHGEPGLQYIMAPTGTMTAKLIASNKRKKAIKLNFTTSQRYDFVIRNSIGKEVIRWSKIKGGFAEVIGEEIIGAGEQLLYEETLLLGEIANPLPLGAYTIEGIITADMRKKLSDQTRFKIISTPVIYQK